MHRQSIVYKDTSTLIPYVGNSRTHSDDQIKQIAASIQEFGFTNPILIDENNSVIAGHGRMLAAELIEQKEVPCIVLTDLTKAQQKALVIADNQLALNADWDLDRLTLELESLAELDFDIDLLGFDDDFLEALLAPEENEGLTDEDAIPEPPEDPITVLGDIWILGDHRLMCGDSTSIDDVGRLMDGQKVDMVFTDPPYGIDEPCDRSSRVGLATAGKYEQIIGDETIEVAVEAFNLVQTLNIPRQVWWGANYYSHSIPQTGNWFVWDKRVEEKQKDFNSDCELAYVKSEYKSVRIFRHLWKGLIKASEHGQSRVHPTQKPVALAVWSFDYFKNVSYVLDLFGGSGSSLIACEKTNRHCRMMELGPIYCDVIIKRWEDFTGQDAVHSETGINYKEISDKKTCVTGNDKA